MRISLRLTALVALSQCALLAQFSSAIQGVATDSSGAAVPGVTVKVTNNETGIARSVDSLEDGLFRVLSLGPGVYRITTHKPGFADETREAINLATGQTLRIDFTLRVSARAESINVAGQAAAVDTEQGSISGNINQIELKETPLNGNNVFNLLPLQAGMVGRSRSSASGGGGRSGNDPFSGEAGPTVYANGQRQEANSFTMDGSSINSSVSPGFTNLTPTEEAVQEVRVTVNNVSAVEGRNAGAQVEVITKSGTNQFHGGLFSEFQNNTLSARGEFDPAKITVFRKNQFGAQLGGPIVHNRTFFFTSYEGLRQSGGRGSVVTVETQAFANFVTQTRPNSIAAKVLGEFKPYAYATTNLRDLGSPGASPTSIGPPDGIPDVGSAIFVPATEHSGDQYQLRIDHELRPGQDRLYGSYYINQDYSLDGNVRPALNRPFRERSQFGDINETHIFSPAILNEFRGGVIRLRGGNDTPAHLDLPAMSVSGITGFSYGQYPNGWWQTNYNYKDVLSVVHGSHTFKMGAEYRREFANNVNTGNFIPSYSFSTILNFAADQPLSMTRSVNPATGAPATVYVGLRNRSYALFFNDDWKVTRRLSLTLGLRDEYFGPMTDSNNLGTNFIWGPGSYVQGMASGKVDFVKQFYNTPKANLAPRFGFAYDPTGKGKMSIRGGYGISYDHIYSLKIGGYGANPPLVGSATLGPQFGTTFTYTLGNPSAPNLGYPVDPSLKIGLNSQNGIPGARVALSAVTPDLSIPYVHNWFLGVQREILPHLVIEVNYSGSAGHHLLDTYNANRYAGDLLDNIFNGINPSFGTIRIVEAATNSIYHGANFRVRRQFQNGFLVQGAYTFGKSIGEIDDGSVSNNFMDANNHRLDRGPASFDVRQQFSLVGVWQIPFFKNGSTALRLVAGGWQLSGTTILQSGMPFNVTNGAAWPRGDFNADGSSLDRPNAPSASLRTGDWSRSNYLAGLFPASAFPAPVPGTDGNLGRNVFRGPGFAETDLSLAKTFRILERFALQVRFDAFNAFNRVNLNNPVSDLSNSNFGRSTSADTPRVYQAKLRLEF